VEGAAGLSKWQRVRAPPARLSAAAESGLRIGLVMYQDGGMERETRNGICAAFLLCAALGAACGEPSTGAQLPVGTCTPVQRMVASEGADHVAIGSQLSFQSNPPASGAHYPLWGRWGVHKEPLPRGHYVHNLEHGGVVLLYRCDTDCAEIESGLRAVMEGAPADPACSSAIRTRLVLTADPLLDTKVAAAAWTQIYRADCVDGPSLLEFIRANYDHAPESTCAQGQVP
jgi:hypothetical protein